MQLNTLPQYMNEKLGHLFPNASYYTCSQTESARLNDILSVFLTAMQLLFNCSKISCDHSTIDVH